MAYNKAFKAYSTRSAFSAKVGFCVCNAKNGYQGWLDLHKDLGTNREDVDNKITIFVNPLRHGRWAEVKSTIIAQHIEILSVKIFAKKT